ncbi:MAG: squalene--hopene cyclase [Planctomycetaceae bacterium]|nr:squalene--hopene cyclase [Planctomycetaceae bacterium]
MTRQLLILACLFSSSMSLHGAEPVAVTLENVVDPGENQPDEAMAETFSLERAVGFLDSVALTWQKENECFTCHTNFAYLYARPMISHKNEAHRSVREFAEQLVSQRWEQEGPRWDAEVIASATALTFNDRATTGELSDVARTALDRMWTVQRDDGGFNWLKCDWPPMESDDHYGVTLAALAVGLAGEEYAQAEGVQSGVDGINKYLSQNPGPTLHHRAMVLWAAQHLDGLLTDEQQASVVTELRSLQKEDGGWGLATLGDWKRGDDSPQDTESSDGYGTGFVVFVLRQAGVPVDDPAITRGVNWLKTHQRASGRWFTRSLHADNRHYITHAGTAFAVMAIAACEQQPLAAD